MKQIFGILILLSAVIIAGCRQTSVAGVSSSDEEAAWEATIRRNYPGYRPPRNAAPAAFDNTSTRRSAVMKKQAAEPAAAPVPAADAKAAEQSADENDPMVVVDKAAEVTSTDPDAAPKADAPKADAPKADAKAEEVKKAEPKTDAKADEKSAEAVKSAAVPAGAEKKELEPTEPTDSTVYVVKSGDTLGGISKQFYGSARYYEVITRANVDLIKNPNSLKPGMKLIIPKL